MKVMLLVLSVVLLLGAGGGAAVAQSPPAGSAATPAPADYRLGPGDVIDIVVLGQPDLTQTYTIGPDGFISLPLLGRVRAADKTTAQLTGELVQGYRRYLRNPVVTVRVREFRVERVFVMGQVLRPGEYPLRTGEGLVNIIATAGGLSPKADAKRAVIMRGPQTIPVDLDQVLVREIQGQIIGLRPGDIIFVPEVDRRLTVLGQVNRPGAYEYLEGNRISDGVALAGGLTALAAPRKATLTRGNQTIAVDLDKILAQGDPEANLALQPGDLLVVPEETSRVAVLGFVNRPGAYPIKEGDRVMDAIVIAGGNTDRGDLARVSIIRQVPSGQPTVVKVDLRKATQGDLKQNVLLQDRDVVYVAEVGSPDPNKIVPWLSIGVGLLRIIFGL